MSGAIPIAPARRRPRSGGRREPASSLVAAVDIGSNSIHMLVVEPEPGGGYRVLGREKEMVRLGRTAFAEGRLSAEAMDDALEALIKVTTLARLKGAGRVVAVATSAVREAANGRDLLRRVRTRTGLEVRLLSGDEEGRLIHRAVRDAVDLGPGTGLILDVGGGSTEWIVTQGGELTRTVSLPLGSLRCAGSLDGDPPPARQIAALRKRIRGALDELPAAGSVERLVATSGTAVCCAALVELVAAREARAPRDARPPVGGLREVRIKELRRLVAYLAGLPRAALAALPPVGEPRSESILAGAVLLEELIRRAGVDRFQVCDRALREGVVLEALGRPAASAAPEEARRRQVERFARRVDSVYPHAEQTAQLAVRLFDLLVSLHGFGAPEREWLEHAALLHDVGYSIHYRRHHHHSYYLITHAGLEGFDPAEIETIALVARYHRGRRPRKSDLQLAGLPGWQRRTVRGLAAVLRIADALDRTHAHRVRDLYCSIRKKRVRVEVVSDYDVALELEAARARKRLFEKLYRVKLGFHQGLEAAR